MAISNGYATLAEIRSELGSYDAPGDVAQSTTVMGGAGVPGATPSGTRIDPGLGSRIGAARQHKLAELGLAHQVSVRPAAILPEHPKAVNRWILAPLVAVIPALGIRAFDLGRAMLRVGLDKASRVSRPLENKDLKALLRGPHSTAAPRVTSRDPK